LHSTDYNYFISSHDDPAFYSTPADIHITLCTYDARVGILTVAPGIIKYLKTCTVIERTYDMLALPTMTTVCTTDIQAISDGKDENATVRRSLAPPILVRTIMPEPEGKQIDHTNEVQRDNTPVTISFPDSDEEEDVSLPHPQLGKDQQELLYWHIHLSHLLFARLIWMAKWGLLPTRIAKCNPPLCSGCLFGRMTCKPWRTKAQPGVAPKQATQPGECVAIDQLDSTTPGPIGQPRVGIPTIQRYNVATIFIDNYSKLGFVHLQTKLTSDKTVKAKTAFESFAHSNGVKIQHYHADNGHFADKAFRESLANCHQNISFCGVNAYWQNGVAEKRIRDLQESAMTMFLYAQ
jgi:hypothetical protein